MKNILGLKLFIGNSDNILVFLFLNKHWFAAVFPQIKDCWDNIVKKELMDTNIVSLRKNLKIKNLLP